MLPWVEAAKNIGVQVPVLVRLEGTNVEEGQRVLRDSTLKFTVADRMKDSAEKSSRWLTSSRPPLKNFKTVRGDEE